MFDNGNVDWCMLGMAFLCRTGHFCVEPGFFVSNHAFLLSNQAFLCRTSVIIAEKCSLMWFSYDVKTFQCRTVVREMSRCTLPSSIELILCESFPRGWIAVDYVQEIGQNCRVNQSVVQSYGQGNATIYWLNFICLKSYCSLEGY